MQDAIVISGDDLRETPREEARGHENPEVSSEILHPSCGHRACNRCQQRARKLNQVGSKRDVRPRAREHEQRNVSRQHEQGQGQECGKTPREILRLGQVSSLSVDRQMQGISL